MLSKELTLGGQPYRLHILSAAQALDCLKAAEDLRLRLDLPDGAEDLREALAEYGALCAACLQKDGDTAFCSPEDALAGLSLDALCDVYDAYQTLAAEERELSFSETGEREEIVCENL